MEQLSISVPPSNILIVDDQAANLQMLSKILKTRGHKVRPVPNGKLALVAAENDIPDIILLDILMPDLDGYEVCRRFKAHEALKDIPVIFISVLDETADKIRGFQAGGVDYIPSPFQVEEVLARVESHLTLHYYRKALAEKTRQLEFSYVRLQDVENSRDQLIHMVVHDMRNLLTGVMGFLHLLNVTSESKLGENDTRYLKIALRSADDLTDMINTLLDISKMEAREMNLNLVRCDMADLAHIAMDALSAIRESRSITLNAPKQAVYVTADRDILLRIIINLLDNAIKFTDDDGTIVLSVEPVEDRVIFAIRDNGPGIPLIYQEKIFEKFGQVEIRRGGQKCSTGLGLAFCKLAVEAHHGKIRVESESDAGSVFSFEIPGRMD